MVERLRPSQILGLNEDEVASFIDSDFNVRSGLCPNGCGLMHEHDWGQKCEKCNFFCNTKPEKTEQH